MYRLARLVGALAILALGTAGGTLAQEYKKDHLVIENAWARTTIPNRPGAAFLTIKNLGQGDDQLIAARAPSAARAELHSSGMEGGVMKMRKVEAVPVPSGAVAELKPGGFHIMLFGLAKPLTEGEEFPLTLTFEKAGDIALVIKVKAMAAKSMDHGDHGKSHMKMD
jgi:copper(I)-binding protein